MIIATANSPIATDIKLNGETTRRIMTEASRHGARLVQFSEGSVTGYPTDAETAGRLKDWAIDWDQAKDQLSLIAHKAKELDIWVVVGGAHRLARPSRPHNSMYVISNAGELVDRYDKRYCSHNELAKWFTPGFRPTIVDIGDFRFGLALCIELNFPELFMEYRDLGVDCVLFSTSSRDRMIDAFAKARAAENNYWFSVSVHAGRAAATPSGVVGPHGLWLARCKPDEEFVCVELDREDPELNIALKLSKPWRAQARQGEIYTLHKTDDPRSMDHTTF